MSQVIQKYRDTVLKITQTIAAAAPASSVNPANIQEDPLVAAQQTYQVPVTQTLDLLDCYIKVAGDINADGRARIIKNAMQSYRQTSNLSTLLVSNPQRPAFGPAFRFMPGDQLSVQVIIDSAVGTSSVTNTFYIPARIYYAEVGTPARGAGASASSFWSRVGNA